MNVNDTILVSKQTFDELIKQVKQFVKLLDLKICQEEERIRKSYVYVDSTYLQELQEQKIAALTVIERAIREALLTSTQMTCS